MPGTLRQLADEQISSIDDAVRLIIVHPNYFKHRWMLAKYLREEGVYVRFYGNGLSHFQLREQVNAAITHQKSAGSRQVRSVLILDEADRGMPEDLDAFLRELLTTMDPGTRIVLFSRRMPGTAISAEMRSHIVVVPNDESFMLWDYLKQNDDTALLEVRAFGTGRVYLNSRVIEEWDGVLPRSLFFYLVDRGMATRNDIFSTFWPNLPPKEATNVFHVTKRKISEVLGMDLTVYWSGFYRISPKINLSYDVILFTDLLQKSAVSPPSEAERLLSNAVALYRGSFLSGLSVPWVKERRHELAQSYSEALASLAKISEDSGHEHAALGFYLRAAANNPHREDLATNIMTLYRKLGMPADALVVYDRLTAQLEQNLGMAPAPHLVALAESIRREMS